MEITLEHIVKMCITSYEHLSNKEIKDLIVKSSYIKLRRRGVSIRLYNTQEENASVPALFPTLRVRGTLRILLDMPALQFGPIDDTNHRPYIQTQAGLKEPVYVNNIVYNTLDYALGTSTRLQNRRTEILIPNLDTIDNILAEY
jgi:hypothetical protein